MIMMAFASFTWCMTQNHAVRNDQYRLTQFFFVQCSHIANHITEIFGSNNWYSGFIKVC